MGFRLIRSFADSQINLSFGCGCREAKIHDALLFFDECEAVFEDREKHGSNHVNMLLTEVEKHEGIIIMATNRFDTSTATACTDDTYKGTDRPVHQSAFSGDA